MEIILLYDGANYFYQNGSEGSLEDSIDMDSYFNVALEDLGAITDSYGVDVFSNIAADSTFVTLFHSATQIKHFNDVVAITDGDNGVYALSNKFIWYLDNNAHVSYSKFITPNLVDIKCIKYYQNHIYVLHKVLLPSKLIYNCSDTMQFTDLANVHGNDYQEIFLSSYYHPPLPEFYTFVKKEYYVYRISKFTTLGEEISFIDFEIDNNVYLVSPTLFDIFNDMFYIVDIGEGAIKLFDMYGYYQRTIRSKHTSIIVDIAIEDEDYMWITSYIPMNYYTYSYKLLKIDTRSDRVLREITYKNKPLISMTITDSSFDLHVLDNVSKNVYKYYKNFVYNSTLTGALYAHSTKDMVATKTNLYVLNKNPTELTIANLVNNTCLYAREVNFPVQIADILSEGNNLIVADVGAYEVGTYYLYGSKDSTLLYSIQPKGILKLNGFYYITDTKNNNVIKYSKDDNVAFIIYKELIRPTDIITDGEFIYVLDTGGNNIKKITHDGELITTIGAGGSGEGKFQYPLSISIKDFKLFVLDHGNFRVQVLTLNGGFLYSFELAPPVTNIEFQSKVEIINCILDAVEDTKGCTDFLPNNRRNPQVRYLFGYNKAFFYNTMFSLNIMKNYNIKNINLIFYGYVTGVLPSLWANKSLYIRTNLETSFYPEYYYDVRYPAIDYGCNSNLSSRLYFNGVDSYIPRDSIKLNSNPLALTELKTTNLYPLISNLYNSEYWTSINQVVSFQSYFTLDPMAYALLGTLFKIGNDPVYNVSIEALSPKLNIEYDAIKYKRRKGFFNHMVMDNDHIYISDISEKVINIYTYEGTKVSSFHFEGTFFKAYNDQVFVTDINNIISYTNKFTWGVAASYTFETTDSQCDINSYNITISWASEYIENFEQGYAVAFSETYEWFNNYNFIMQIDEENLLNVPVIVWG